jgi:Protein of unknown function (DUF3040)
MLNEAERRRIEELDRLLITEEPGLAEACRDMQLPTQPGRSPRLVVAICAILAAVVMLSAAFAHEAALVALGVLLVGCAVAQHVRIHCQERAKSRRRARDRP